MLSGQEFLEDLKGVVTVIPREYVDALLVLHERLNRAGVKWVVNGNLAESLKTVDIQPDCINIVCSAADTQRIYNAVIQFNPTQPRLQIEQQPRNAVCDGKEYPLYTRSSAFDFTLNGVKVRVEGDLQFRVDNWDWGDPYEFAPDYVNVVGKEIAITPLQIRYNLYSSLGWMDRAEKIRQVFERRIKKT